MTTDEIALLRELVKWRRNNGHQFVHYAAQLRLTDGRTIAWNTFSALRWPETAEVGVHAQRHRPLNWHEIRSVTEAVDVLVALGYLPPRFSSAYRAGWDVGRSDMEHPVAAGAEFRAIMPAAWRS